MLLVNLINPVTYAIAWTVVHSTWQILLIVLIAAIVQTSMHRQSASTRYNVLVGASFLIAICSILTFIYLYQEALIVFANESTLATLSPKGPYQPIMAPIGHEVANISWSIRIMEYVNNHILLIISIWVIGMVLALIKLIGNVSYVLYVKNNFNFPVDEYWSSLINKIADSLSLDKKVELLESALVRSPIVVGFLKPMILFPIGAINRLDPSEVEAILAHELAHIKRNDFIINIIVSILESIYYYHPAMWWHTSQIRREREYCCDDMAIAYTGNRFEYAKSLVAVQEMALYSPSLAMAFANNENKNELLSRVNRLVHKTSKSINMKEKSIAGSFVLMLLFTILFAFKPALSGSEADCLPEENSSEYLYFDKDGNLDSLLLDFTVSDGDYSYSRENIEMKLTVKNSSVIAFNINGLDVPGRDIKKFEELIRSAIIESGDEAIPDHEGDESYKIYDQLTDDLKKDNLLNSELNKIKITPTSLTINGVQKPIGKYLTYYNTISELTNREEIKLSITGDQSTINIEGDEDGHTYSYSYSTDMPAPPEPPLPPSMPDFPNFIPPPPPPAPPVPSKKMIKSEKEFQKAMRDYEKKVAEYNKIHHDEMEKLNDEAQKISMEQHEEIMKQHEASMRDHENSMRAHDKEMKKHNQFRDQLLSALIKDGYLSKNEDIRISWNSKEMRVNEKTVKQTDLLRYQELYKSFGWKIEKSFNYNANITKD